MEKDLFRPELFQDKDPRTKQYLGKLALSALASIEVAVPSHGDSFNRLAFVSNEDRAGNWRDQYEFRQQLLKRDLARFATDMIGQVTGGLLICPYWGLRVLLRGVKDVRHKVERDHIVSLRDAWESGASAMCQNSREELNVDPLENVMVSKEANQDKGAAAFDAWRPTVDPELFAARQVAVKSKYRLSMTPSEVNAISSVLKKPDLSGL